MSGPAEALEQRIRERAASGGPALIAYLTAGFPSKERFLPLLGEIGAAADVVEIGVPFSDPMADGATIQDASRVALEQGVSLRWILGALREAGPARPNAPLVIMSYLNPILRLGLGPFAEGAAAGGVSAVIVPDLPLEESAGLRDALAARGLGVVQMVTPVSPPERVRALAAATRGFLYAVTVTGVTGGRRPDAGALRAYLDGLRGAGGGAPVCAGFGIRSREQVDALRGAADGVIVGTALIDEIRAGGDAGAFLRGLRAP